MMIFSLDKSPLAVTESSSSYREAPLVGPDPWLSVRPAGFGIRALARLIDVAVRYAAAIAGAMIFFMASSIALPEGTSLSENHHGGVALSMVIGGVGMVLYHAISESLGGASLGKIVCGLRVTTPSLGCASLGSAVVRNLALFVDAILFGAVAWCAMKDSPRQQRYGDCWGGTMVVHAAGSPDLVRGTPDCLALGVLVGFTMDVVTSFIVCTFSFGGA